MVVEFLTSRQALLNLADNRGQTPLLYAASAGFVTTVEFLMKDERIDIHCRDKDGRSVLFQACQNGHVDVVSLLLKTGARGFINVEVSTHDWTLTPLAVAIQRDEPELVQLLVRNGADWDIELEGENILVWAVRGGRWKCAQLLLELFHEKRGINLESALPKYTIALQLARFGCHPPRHSPFHSNRSAGRGGVILSQLDRDGKEVEMTVEAARLIYDDDYTIRSFVVNAAGESEFLADSVAPPSGVPALLIGELKDKFCVDEEILVKAVSNRKNSLDAVEQLLDAGGIELQITGRVVIAAIRFQTGQRQDDLFTLLIRRCGNAVPIEPDVLEAVAWELEGGLDYVGTFAFFKACQDRLKIPVSYIKAAAGRYALQSHHADFGPLLVCIDKLLIDEAISVIKIAEAGNLGLGYELSPWLVDCAEEIAWIGWVAQAIQSGQDDVAESLIREGARKYGPSGKDYVPVFLVLALRRKNRSMAGVVQSLVEWPGLDVNAPVLTGRQPVLFAAKRLDEVRILIKAGANPNYEDLGGDTPITCARRDHEVKILQALQDGELRDENGPERAPEQASERGKLDDVGEEEGPLAK